MVKVQGSVGDIAYRVTLTGKAGRPVTGSKAIAAAVKHAISEGRTVLVGPTGPRQPVTATDPVALVAFLASLGQVQRVDGIAEEDLPEQVDAGVVL